MAGDSSTRWRPRASMQILRRRARVLADVRRFFEERGVLEVTPPVLGRHTVTAPNIHTIRARSPALSGDAALFLQTSPEYSMKRLLAAGSGPIYALTPAFRDGESGRHHNPEFTMLEWYRPGFSLHALMDEVQQLVGFLVPALAWKRRTYRDAFLGALGLDPDTASDDTLAGACAEFCLRETAALERDDMLDLLFSLGVQPRLGEGGVFVHAYPASQAALACVSSDPDPVALRFELFVGGIELANGYQELLDADEQRRRFDADRDARRRRGLEDVAIDEALLGALRSGLPPTSGVAVGFERLLMVILGLTDVRDAMAFSFDRL